MSDADSAWLGASLLNSDDWQDPLIVGAHLSYLTARAGAIIRRHPRQAHAHAQRAYRDTVVPGADVERIVTWWLCPCHRDWGARARGLAPAL